MSRSFSRENLNDSVLNPRLQREGAQTGEITASLLWNGTCDLDLHATVKPDAGKKEHIYCRHKQGTGGQLDVDANASSTVEEPVENIYWDKPPKGSYTISVNLYKIRGSPAGGKVPFRVQLKLPKETLDYEGTLKNKEQVVCFKFFVGEDSKITMGKLALPKITRKRSVIRAPMKSMKTTSVMKVKAMKTMAKAMKTMKATTAMKTIARGRLAKVRVFQGKFKKTSGGLTKDALMKNSRGKVVSKAKSAKSKKLYRKHLQPWHESWKNAKAELGLTGFALCKKGTPFYIKIMEKYKQLA
eukprot:CAMPEP_0194493454 /NCGR_PEP_ID=MMETSP0253-20130528/11663_1 /TAXON_ID=2966 /ORGANISM="Noctiluca scintillans" /LENGTH=298 /DNA_ID=CAMNT_0039334439 /DNA_START=98 /DNA_END=994 /DNA_ORIENTATION=-